MTWHATLTLLEILGLVYAALCCLLIGGFTLAWLVTPWVFRLKRRPAAQELVREFWLAEARSIADRDVA